VKSKNPAIALSQRSELNIYPRVDAGDRHIFYYKKTTLAMETHLSCFASIFSPGLREVDLTKAHKNVSIK
jgi:hypothetical protein